MVDNEPDKSLDYAFHCPKCKCLLNQVEILDIPIEKCPQCSGVWLDAGELELIYEREKAKDSWISRLFKFDSK
ncbi:MAG: zf-TFIIB domain-containing protein [Candidatus Obscuribacterales bacterium]|nr:zf-TFIIB domain-containing protein [Candidatus Obscuribacterales bacterium]